MRCPPRERRSARPAATGPRPRSAGSAAKAATPRGPSPSPSRRRSSSRPRRNEASFRRLPGISRAGAARACLEIPAGRALLRRGGRVGMRRRARRRVADLVSAAASDTQLRDGKRAAGSSSAPHRALAEGTPGGVSGRRRRRAGRGWGDRVLAGPASLLGLRRRHRRGRRGAPHRASGNGRDGRERLARPTAFLARHDLRGRRPDGHREGRVWPPRCPGGRPRGRLGVCSPALLGGRRSRTDIVREGRDPYRGGRSKVIRRFTRAFGRAPTPRASAPRRFPRSAAVPHSVRPELCVRTARPGRSCGGDAPRVVRIRGHDVIRKPHAI